MNVVEVHVAYVAALSLVKENPLAKSLMFLNLGESMSVIPRQQVLPGLLAALLMLAGCSGQQATPQQQTLEDGERPNVVMIISDDHAWNDHGFMGSSEVQTPNLDRLASESMVYTRGYTPTSVCRPSLATMVTGLYPHQHGITGNDPPGESRDPEARAEMVDVFARNANIARLLDERGYVSHQSGKWWEGDPTEQGFTAAMTHGIVEEGGRHGDEGLKIGREGMEPVLDFIDAAGEEPFFVFYAPFLPHTPHNPPDRLLEKYQAPGRPVEVARYYAMIDWFDETVGELLSHLDREGLAENTMVLYVVDNGWIQAVGEQEMADMRAKMSPYDAGMRTPIMMRWPGVVEPGRDEETLVSTIDLAPTVLNAANVEPPSGLPGIDLRDSEALADREMVFGELFAHTAVDIEDPVANLKYRSVVREDGWKLILPYTPNREVVLMINGAVSDWMRFEPELYNVIDDPYEQHNLAAERPALVNELRAEINEWWPVSP